MKQNRLILVMVATLFASYLLSGMMFDWFFGVSLPIVGSVGVEPFGFLRDFGVLIGGSVIIIVYLMCGRKTK